MWQKFINYLKESKAELHKVTWPTKKEAINATILVIIISFLVAAFLGTIDYVLNIGVEQLLF